MREPYFEGTEEEQEIKLTDYINIILRYKWLVITIFITVMIASFIYTSKAPRIYKATSKVLIEDKMSQNLLFSSFSSKATSINNNIHILKSIPVMRRAYLILKVHPHYDNLPIKQSANSIEYLKSNMSVDTERETDILIINYESINSIEAKESANALAYAFMQEDTDYARIEFRNSREFLANQLDEKDRKLRASEEDLRNYKLEHGISMLSEETQELIRQSSELGALLSEAESELEVANNHLSFLQKELSTQDELLSDINSVLTSPLLEQLKEEIVKNQTMYVNLLIKSEYSPDHPEMIALNKGIESAKLRLGEEIQRIITVKAGSSDPLKYRSSLIEKISTAQIDQNINDTKVTSLRKAVGDYNLRMSILPDTEVELARLERNFTINEKVYSMLITKYEDAKIAEESKIGNIRIVEEAQEPQRPIKPNRKMNMIIAFVIGAGLGIGAALLLNSLDSKIRTFDDVRRYVNLSILGTIPFIHISEQDIEDIDKTVKDTETDTKSLEIFKNQIEARLITSYAPKSSASESFRILRTNILAKKKKEESLTALITSAGPKEGKTTIHSNLAIALAQMEAKVVLVDLDLRRPMIHTLFSMKKENGISDFLYDKSTKLENFIERTQVPNLDIITSGYIPPNPSELLASKRTDEALAILKEKYDYILLDSPPVIAVTDSMVLAKKADLLLMVVKIGTVDKHVIKRAKELLDNIDVSITGAIINGIHPHKYYSSYEYNYYYYYYYGKTEDKKKKLPRIFRKNKSIS